MSKNYLGTVVYSKAGRDVDRKFIIMDIIDKEYVYVCDGDLRKVEKPKKKKMKHLMFTETVAEDIRKSLMSDVEVSNLQVRRFLQSLCTNKEV